MTIIRQGINGSFIPWLYYSLREKRYGRIREITKILAVFMCLMSASLMLMGPELLRLAAPPSYYEAVADVPAIMIGCYCIFIYALFQSVEVYEGLGSCVAIASIVSAVLNVILNFICIPAFGYLVAGYTTMVSYFAMAVLHCLFLRKAGNEFEENVLLFDYRFLFMSVFALAFVAVGIFFLYPFFLVRYAILFTLLIAACHKRQVILQTLSAIKKER